MSHLMRWSSFNFALCYISALSHTHQHHHHPHSRNGMAGSLLHQTGHRHMTPGAAIGTSETAAGHSGSAAVTAGNEIGWDWWYFLLSFEIRYFFRLSLEVNVFSTSWGYCVFRFSLVIDVFFEFLELNIYFEYFFRISLGVIVLFFWD